MWTYPDLVSASMMLATSAKSVDIDIDIDIDVDIDIDIDIDVDIDIDIDIDDGASAMLIDIDDDDDDDIEEGISFLVPRNASKVSSASTLFSNDLCCEWVRLRMGLAA